MREKENSAVVVADWSGSSNLTVFLRRRFIGGGDFVRTEIEREEAN